jgi:hypothetical protein
MHEVHNRAFKEWAVVCEALKSGRQTVLIRKGGIREEDGIFRVDDREFFLMPTYDHQTPDLLQPEGVESLARILEEGTDPSVVSLDSYAVVDAIETLDDEDRLRALSSEHIWNESYIRLRLDYNPYDPLYVLMLRVYRLPRPYTFPMIAEYGGCKSWVTLQEPIPTAGSVAAIADEEFARRREAVLSIIHKPTV